MKPSVIKALRMTREQEKDCVAAIAKAFGWDKESTHDLGLMLWALFRYYAWRPRPGDPQ